MCRERAFPRRAAESRNTRHTSSRREPPRMLPRDSGRVRAEPDASALLVFLNLSQRGVRFPRRLCSTRRIGLLPWPALRSLSSRPFPHSCLREWGNCLGGGFLWGGTPLPLPSRRLVPARLSVVVLLGVISNGATRSVATGSPALPEARCVQAAGAMRHAPKQKHTHSDHFVGRPEVLSRGGPRARHLPPIVPTRAEPYWADDFLANVEPSAPQHSGRPTEKYARHFTSGSNGR